MIPHRRSIEEIKIALEKLDALTFRNKNSLLYLAENNDMSKFAENISSDYIDNNVKRLKSPSNTRSKLI